ncbi:MAG: EamA family transporter [Planctomycetota bacterium]|nr:EamA family transporter [Planctomycetota bacterium]
MEDVSEASSRFPETPYRDPISSPTVGRLMVLVAAILWSSSGFFAKAPIFEDWPAGGRSLLLAFWRAVFAVLVLSTMVRRPRLSWRMLPMVLCFVAMNYTFLEAMVRTEASVVIWLQHTAPAWVLIGSVLFFHERVQRSDIWLLSLASIGVSIILIFQLGGKDPFSILLGLLSGITYAGVVLSLRWLRNEDAAWLITLNHLVTALAFLPAAMSYQVWPHDSQWLYLAGFGALQMGIPYVLFAAGVQRISGHQASGIVLLEPVLLPVWVYLAWHSQPDYQPPSASTLIGATLILAGLVMRFFGAKNEQQTPPESSSS